MTTPQLHHAASSYVFRLLGRGRARTQRTPGGTLDEVLATLREGGRSALIEVELAGGSLGRLLIQVGRLVYAQHGDSSGEKALAEIQRGAADAHFYTLELSDEQIIFACAALAGIPLALGETLGEGSEQIPALLKQLSQQNFTGVMALEQGLQTLVWRFQRGRVINTVKPPPRIRAGRLTQIVWQEQMLREVGEAEPGAVAHTAAPSRSPVQTTSAQTTLARNLGQPAPVRSSSVQTTSLRNTVTRNTTTQNTAVQNNAVQGTRVQSTHMPTTYVPNTSIHDTVANDASVRNTSVSQTQFGSSRHKRQDTPEGTEEVWKRFQSVLQAQLGGRAERVFALMYSELGGFSRAELIGRLTPQVERIAGSAAARTFRDGL